MHLPLVSFALLLMLSNTAVAVKDLMPRSRDVPLEEFTKFTLDVAPDLGVVLVFPFELDTDTFDPPYSITTTNNTNFCVGSDCGKGNSSGKVARSSNMLPISLNKPSVGGGMYLEYTVLGSVFISVDGYHIAIILRAQPDLAKAHQVVRFKLSEDKRDFLINRIVERKLKTQEQGLATNAESIDAMATQKALALVGALVLEDPRTKNVKVAAEGKLTSQETVEVFLDKYYIYDKHGYVMLAYILDNKSSKTLVVNNVKISIRTDKNAPDAIIENGFTCAGNIGPGEKRECVITTQNKKLLDAYQATVAFATNYGGFNVTW